MILSLSVHHVHGCHFGGIVHVLMFFEASFMLPLVLYLFSALIFLPSCIIAFIPLSGMPVFLLKSGCYYTSVGNWLNCMCLFCIMPAY